MNIDFIKELYIRELDRKDKFLHSLQFPVTILALLLGSAAVYAEIYRGGADNVSMYFSVPFVVLIVSCVCGLLSIIASFLTPKRYQKLASYKSIAAFKQELDDYYKDEEKSTAEHENYLKEKLNQAFEFNEESNNRTHSLIHAAYVFLSIGAVMLVVTAIPYFQIKLSLETPPQEVKIVDVDRHIKEIENIFQCGQD